MSLFGVPVDDFDEHARLGYVPQRHTLSASVRATVEEIVAVGRLPHRRWWRPSLDARDRGRRPPGLELVGLADRADADVSTLSGGQQRRVLIARALAAEPDVLVMDEPTAGVDTASQEVLAQVLARLVARGTTMVIVTHELAALPDIVTRIVLVCRRPAGLRRDTRRDFATRAARRTPWPTTGTTTTEDGSTSRSPHCRARRPPAPSTPGPEATMPELLTLRLHAAGARSPPCSSASPHRWSASSSCSAGCP